MRKVLIVNDKSSILALLTFNLGEEGYQVTTSESGKNSFELALSNQYGFTILDVMLPGMDSLEIIRTLRREKVNTPISILTAKDEQVDKTIGLEIGTDDYLTKPLSPGGALARMKTIFRRLRPTTTETLQEDAPKASFVTGGIRVDEQNHEVFVHNQPIGLTPKESELFIYFMKRKGRIISRKTLLERIWQYNFAGQSHVVDVHTNHLHDKIEPDPKRPVYLVAVRGFGYRFQEPKR